LEQKKIWGIDQFLEIYQVESTRKIYIQTLKQYFRIIYPELEKLYLSTKDKSITGEQRKLNKRKFLDRLNSLSIKYFSENRDYRVDVVAYRKWLNGSAPMTIRNKISAVRTYLEYNGITFPKLFFKQLKGNKAVKAVSKEHVPSPDEIRRLLELMPFHGKVFTAVLATSGMRLGECFSLKVEDLELDRNPARINISFEYAKNGENRITFISQGTCRLLKDWLTQKKDYFGADDRYQDQSDLVFPFDPGAFRKVWNRALEKAGLFEKDRFTGRITLTPHKLRKYFRTYGEWSNPDIPSCLMGHQEGLHKIYARVDQAKQILEKGYLEAEPRLALFQDREATTKLKEELEEYKTNGARAQTFLD